MIQTRSEENGLITYSSFKEAMKAADKDNTIWGIRFDLNYEEVVLVRDVSGWVYVRFD